MMTTGHDARDAARHAGTILEYWFSTLDDAERLDRAVEPFRTCYQRWYGKDPAVDAEIRTRFEPLLLEVTKDGRRLNDTISAFRQAPYGLLAFAQPGVRPQPRQASCGSWLARRV